MGIVDKLLNRKKEQAPNAYQMANRIRQDYNNERNYKKNIQEIKQEQFSSGSSLRGQVGIRPRVGTRGSGSGVGRGRPQGTKDPRYAAYGGVYGYRKYMSHQRNLERLRLQQQGPQMPQNLPNNYPQQVQRQQIPMQQQQIPMQQQTYQQQAPIQQPMPQQYVQPIQQGPAHLSFNPEIDRGNLLKIKSPFSPEAMSQQNISQNGGDMMSIMRKGLNVFNVDRPTSNPNGEYFTNPDLLTGRQVMQRRIREGPSW